MWLVFTTRIAYIKTMKNEVIPVEIKGVVPMGNTCAIFIGNDSKVFVINVDPQMAAIISMFINETPKERPLTHDLINNIFKAFNITVERVVITELRKSTYYARLILKAENELGMKIVELDARPSDCIALAIANKRPIYVSATLFEEVEDMSELLDQINQAREDSEDSQGESGEEKV